ncbi:MAG: helix-turn-helix transcriptional regulator [Oliverpabstia sp.]|nr:helix-turn-helix transcriptional regulator [Oliverpabstia sp.]
MINQYYIDMGQRIKLRRKELKISQTELAELIDVSNNHMSNIENAKTKPSMDNFIKLCEVLKVTPDYLLLGSIHINNIPLDIYDKLRLCSKDDLKLANSIMELLVKRNHSQWNSNNFI